MKLQDFRTLFTDKLSSIYPKTEIDSFFFLLIEEKLGLQRIDTVLQPNFTISEDITLHFQDIINRLKKEEPIQYILGKTEFFGFPFLVNEHTLIPRPETEELVSWVLDATKDERRKTKDITILDIGTGSGCIPIALKKNLPTAEVFAIDISKEALAIAKQNAKLNNITVNFIEEDILTAEKLLQKFDIIISNPPYVRELEKVEIKNNVLQFEPHSALFVSDKNPLLFYDAIADLAKKHLNPKGKLFFEINQYLGKETVTLLQQKGFSNVALRKDLFGNNRMLKANL